MHRALVTWLVLIVNVSIAKGHDIPDEQVDRSIQATLRPGRLEIEYEVSLAELTLARDLRLLIGVVPGA
ncbi:MAG: ABC transporter permease, partial [Isosphaeraceae bacterium]